MSEIITTEDLNNMKDVFIEAMKKNFKNDGEISPVAIIISHDGQPNFIPTPYRDLDEKRMMMEGVRAICQKVDAIALFLINEAWIKQVDKNDKATIEKADKEGISSFDDKKEVAMMIFETKLTSQIISFDLDRVNM